MSDEPKRRSRAWGWWAVVLLVLYPLSSGPEFFVASRLGIDDDWTTPIYAPWGWVVRQWQPLEDANEVYFEWWAGLGIKPEPDSLGDF
jgi:hypothetical protein